MFGAGGKGQEEPPSWFGGWTAGLGAWPGDQAGGG